MGRVLWHVTLSLDGFIAAPGDDVAWLADYLGRPGKVLPHRVIDGLTGAKGG